MRRVAVLVALLACDAREPAPAAPVHWTYAPPPVAFPLGKTRVAHVGRGQATQLVVREGIAGEPKGPLRLPTLWPVPGAGPARAIVYGLDGDKPAVELIDVDGGRVVWRDEAGCAAPVVGVTADAVVCTDATGTRALGLDGKPRWRGDKTFIAMTGERVVAAAVGEAVILDAKSGDELARVKLPANLTPDAVLASCGDAGRELFAVGVDGKLARVVDAKIAWATAVGNVSAIDACDGASVVVTSGTSLIAIARDTGKIAGRVDGVLGAWPARDGSDRLEIATANGVASYPRELSASTPTTLPALGELLGKRGDQRLVRAGEHAAVLLDRAGVRAYVPLSELGAVLGDGHVIAASWRGSSRESVRRFRLPAPWQRTLRIANVHAPLGVPAPLRDLPASIVFDEVHALTGPSSPAHTIAAAALDGNALYALALADDTAGIARFDLATKTWPWLRADACGAPSAFAIAVAREVVACAAHGEHPGVRALAKDGTPRWQWLTDDLDALTGAGDVMIAFAADHATILDATTGRELATLASDDGDAVRAAAIEAAGTTIVVTYERGRVVARLPHARMVPAWSLAVDGIVRAIAPVGDGVLVELDGGDAFHLDGKTGAVVALPGLDLGWHAWPDVLAGDAPGEPVPPAQMPVEPPAPPTLAKGKPAHVEDPDHPPPPIAKPWLVPPPGPPAWQLTLFEPAGGLRVRNDYALAAPVDASAARGPAGSPIVALSGADQTDALVIDPTHGEPLRRVVLPGRGRAFSTVVDGKPVVGVVLANPLRVVLF